MSPSYDVRRTPKIEIDGRLSHPSWSRAPRSPRFVDMGNARPGLLDTRAAALWDDEHLYVGFWVDEPYPEARLTERDSIIFSENDIELFIIGEDCYYEFEINALGTVYEVLFVWHDALTRGSRFDTPEFDVMSRDAVTFGGNFDRDEKHFWRGTHPRGLRWAFLDWDLPGLKTAVHVDGQLNDFSEPSKGWTVEMAIPWTGLKHLAGGRSLPPTAGDIWQLFFGRFQKIHLGDAQVQAAWCWTPHGQYDTHMPEKFTPVRFVDEEV